MSLKLLLDQHLPARLAAELRRHLPETPSESVHTWRSGALVGQTDAALLQAAQEDGWTLVTYDQRTIPALLVLWGETGTPHAGVVLIDQLTIHFRDYGLLVRALSRLVSRLGQQEWVNRVVYLPRPPQGDG